jgi:hypothetical protein
MKRETIHSKGLKMKTLFRIEHYSDYHEIYDKQDAAKGRWKVLEIGCFPVADAGCCEYFALSYLGKRPRLKQVYDRLLKKIVVGDFVHYRSSENIGFSPEDVRVELKSHGIR